MAIAIFSCFVAVLLGISFYLSARAKSAPGYFVAGGKIPWQVNGLALTGGYLSAASLLGICGMIAFTGFDGYLYSIGFLSGWVVALFVVAEPLRRLGKYTLADALASKFENKGIHFAVGVSTLVISLFYLVPQMVGAGVLMEPLAGIPHHWGVVMVGGIVIAIVASAGMTSTTYVQFLQASLLIVTCTVIVVAVCVRGLSSTPVASKSEGENHQFRQIRVLHENEDGLVLDECGEGYKYERSVEAGSGDSAERWVLLSRLKTLSPESNSAYTFEQRGRRLRLEDEGNVLSQLLDGSMPHGAWANDGPADPAWGSPTGGVFAFVDGLMCFVHDGVARARVKSWWRREFQEDGTLTLREAQHLTSSPTRGRLVNGFSERQGSALLPMGRIVRLAGGDTDGPVGPFKLLAAMADSETLVELPRTAVIQDGDDRVTLYYAGAVPGNELMRPGGHFNLAAASPWPKLDFVSLMLALFFGTAALPHVLIRYYTVPDSTAARRSTVVAITAIGFFYVLTLYLGLGAIVNGVLNPQNSNMSAPLLARSFGETLFATITSIAFATVLATASGLIVAASGAVANDLVERSFGLSHTPRETVKVAKLAAVTVGVAAMVLGILLRDMNVGFLVGWAFAVAASANFPSIVMVLFWKRTTAQGIIASIFTGIAASMAIILLGPDMFEIYGLQRADALIPLGQPAIVSIPLSFLTLVVVSLLTVRRESNGPAREQVAS